MGRITDQDSARLDLTGAQRAAHEQSLVIDLHVDCIIQQRLFGYDITAEHDPAARWRWTSFKYDLARAVARIGGGHQPYFNQTDIPRMRRGGYDAAALTLHAWPRQSERAWIEIQRQLEYFHEVVQQGRELVQARGPADIRQAARAGQLALFPVIEGLHCLGAGGHHNDSRRLDRIEQLFRDSGVRYITLAHFSSNDAATHGFGMGSNQRRGLTDFGRQVIRKMNEVGMLIDVSHLNHRCVMDACELSSRPVIASHTGLLGAATTSPKRYHGRLLRDEALRAICQTGGVAGLMFAPRYLTGSNATLECVSQHLRYARQLLDDAGHDGARHLAIGSDLDGWLNSLPSDLNDAADVPRLTATLLQDGFSPAQISQIWGENFLRVWSQVLG